MCICIGTEQLYVLLCLQESADEDDRTLYNQMRSAHGCLSFGTIKGGLGNETIKSKSPQDMLCIDANNELQSHRPGALFYDPFSSYENESKYRFNGYQVLSDSRKEPNEAEDFLVISDVASSNKENSNIVVKEEGKSMLQRRSANEILALFSERPETISSNVCDSSINGIRNDPSNYGRLKIGMKEV